MSGALPKRYAMRIDVHPSGCWLWVGRRHPDGYGSVRFRGGDAAVHRVIYEILVGPIPEGLTLDHLCRVRHCVNPGHLDPCSMGENVRRGTSPVARNAAKTACAMGHPFDASESGRYGPKRYCRECKARTSRAAYARNKTKRLAQMKARQQARRENAA